MKLTFIGMSGVGKTYLAKKMEKQGYLRFSVDDFIEHKLKRELNKYGYEGLSDIARWMGQPYDERYKMRSKRYLDLERKSLEQIIKLIKLSNEKKIIVDTTGSIIYLNKDIIDRLSELTKIIYFETPAQVLDSMCRQYISDPKPVIWGEIFDNKNSESNTDSLLRSYPELLKFRQNKYKEFAQLTITMHRLRSPDFDIESLLIS